VSNDWFYGVLRAFDGTSAPSHGTFWAGMCPKFGSPGSNQIAKTHTANSHDTIFVAAKQFHIKPM
jgi:hypothetical protein